MSFLIPSVPDQVNEGPRLDSLAVQDSAFGHSIPIIYGRARIPGNIIWATDLEEERVESSDRVRGKGGGGGTVTSITYNYYANFAVAFCEGPIVEITKIWADGKLILDRITGNSILRDLQFIEYKGTETQEPNSFIESHTDNKTPAYRGLVYIVFERMPLANFANHIPAITAEILQVAGEKGIISTQEVSVEGVATGHPFYDYERGFIYIGNSSAQVFGTFINVYNSSTYELINTYTVTSLGFNHENARITLLGLDKSTGNMIIMARDPTFDIFNQVFFLLVDFEGVVLQKNAVSGFIPNSTNLPGPSNIIFRRGRRHIMIGYILGNIRIWDLNGIYNTTLFKPDTIDDDFLPILPTLCNNYCIAGWMDIDTILLFSIDARGSIFRTTTFIPSDIVDGATNFTITTPDNGLVALYDPVTNSIFLSMRIDMRTYMIRYNLSINQIEWVTQYNGEPLDTGTLVAHQEHTNANNYVLRGNFFAFPREINREFIKFTIATGETELINNQVSSVQEIHRGWWDDSKGIWIIFSRFELITYISRLPYIRYNIGSIISDIVSKCGLVANQYDVTSITRDIAGYVIPNSATGKAIIKQLMDTFGIVSSAFDSKLLFIQSGVNNVLDNISYTNMLQRDTEASPYDIIRTQEPELPEIVRISAQDVNREYQPNTGLAKRIRNPFATMNARGVVDFEISGSNTHTHLKHIAERILYTLWSERNEIRFNASLNMLKYVPGDIISLVLIDVMYNRARIKAITIGNNWQLEIVTVSETEEQYIESDIPGDTGDYHTPGEIPEIGLSRVFLLDIPFILDSYASIYLNGAAVWAAGPYSSVFDWRSAVLYKSQDGANWSAISRLDRSVEWGIIENALVNPSSPWHTDYENILTVRMIDGELESITPLQLANGRNAIAVIKENDEIEIIQFETATQLGNNRYTLSGIVRGRRGTEVYAYEHTDNEVFVILNTTETFGINTGEYDAIVSYRAVSVGRTLESASINEFTSMARNLMPYAPVHHKAVREANTDIILSWIRRTRLGGELIDGIGEVPLSEENELYDIEIYDVTGTNIERIIEDIETTLYVYTMVNQEADGLDMETELNIKVYQKSAVRGRGFARLVTIPVE